MGKYIHEVVASAFVFLFLLVSCQEKITVINQNCQDNPVSFILSNAWTYSSTFILGDADSTTSLGKMKGQLIFNSDGTLQDPDRLFLTSFKGKRVKQKHYELINDTLKIHFIGESEVDTLLVVKGLLERKACNELVFGRWFDAKTPNPRLVLTLTKKN